MRAAFRLMDSFRAPHFGLKVRTPVLIVAAGADPVCSTPAIERLGARLKAGHVIVLPAARHEILMERDVIREEFWAAFDAFIPGSGDAQGLRLREPALVGGGTASPDARPPARNRGRRR